MEANSEPGQNPRRCAKHLLLADEDGRCALCRSRPPSTANGKKWLFMVLGLLLVGFAANHLLDSIDPTRRGEPSRGEGKEGEARTRAVERPKQSTTTREQAANDILDRRARARKRRPLDLSRASRRVTITMYVTDWCPVCTKARRWFQDNDISCQVIDVDTDDRAKRELKRLNPRGSIPTIQIRETVLVGFSPSKISRAIAAAAKNR